MESTSKPYYEKNLSLLSDFKTALRSKDIPEEAIEAHETNVDFYINHYLLYDEPKTAIDGIASGLVRDFLGNFFVHKAMWTNVDEQRASIQSLLIFYEWLAETEKVSCKALIDLREVIAREQGTWFAAMEHNAEESLESWQGEGDIGFVDDLPLTDTEEPQDEIDDAFMNELEALKIPVGDSEHTEDGHSDDAFGELEDIDDEK